MNSGNDMNYLEFKNKYSSLPIISTKDIIQNSENAQNLRNQMNRWQNNGLIQRLRRGLFVFNPTDRKKKVNHFYIANRIYEPSYISLESALSYYDIIPERVINITSVCNQKTMKFNNDFGCFSYQHIKPSTFRGFRSVKFDSVFVFMAEPEKAIVDFLYLNLSKFNKNVKDVILNSYRFQNFEELSTKRLLDLSKYFECKKLNKVMQMFCELVD